MNKNINSNNNLSLLYGLPMVRKHINKEITDLSIQNIINTYKEIELESQNHVSIKKVTKNLQRVIGLSDIIINTNKSKLNVLKKIQLNLNISKSENFNNELTKSKKNESKSILMNEQQYIGLLTLFNSKLASFTIHIYTFTNKSYKQINKNLNNIYIICQSAFINMSSIISKPIVSINPNLIKITLFFY